MTYEWNIPEIHCRPIEMRRHIIKQAVCKEFGCFLSDLITPKKRNGKQFITDAKMAYAYLTKKHFGDTFTRIGLELNMDHSSAIHLIRRMDDRIFTKDQSSERILKLEIDIFKHGIYATT